jgi:hypothetical protein
VRPNDDRPHVQSGSPAFLVERLDGSPPSSTRIEPTCSSRLSADTPRILREARPFRARRGEVLPGPAGVRYRQNSSSVPRPSSGSGYSNPIWSTRRSISQPPTPSSSDSSVEVGDRDWNRSMCSGSYGRGCGCGRRADGVRIATRSGVRTYSPDSSSSGARVSTRYVSSRSVTVARAGSPATSSGIDVRQSSAILSWAVTGSPWPGSGEV